MPTALTSTPFKIGAFSAVSSAFGAGLVAIALTYTPPVDPFGGAPVFEVELFSDAGMSAPTSSQSQSSNTQTRESTDVHTTVAKSALSTERTVTEHRTTTAPHLVVATVAQTSPAVLRTASSGTPDTSGGPTHASNTPPSNRSQQGGDDRHGARTQGAQGGAHDDQYEAQVIRWIDQHKRHPGRLQGIVTLKFEVDRRGRIKDCIITRTSGDQRLDRIAQQQLKDAAPLPRPPRDTSWQTREITVSLDYRSLA